ncbi:MAG: ABC transporter permease [Clostridium sp.]
MRSLKYVLLEIRGNWYRAYSIAKYELMSDMKDTRLGVLWKIINPLIQIFTFWFAFGLGIRNGKPVNGVDYFEWMIVGLIVWFFISPSLISGVKSIHSKTNVITKMKFPTSILPITAVLKELYNHLFMLLITIILLVLRGNIPSTYNLQIIYYLFCAISFAISMNMVISVLNMITRDVSKIVSACMRMLMYLTPILWTMDNLPQWIQNIMRLNPIYYIVEGYRNSLLFKNSMFGNMDEILIFWSITIGLFLLGCSLMYKFKHKLIDLI